MTPENRKLEYYLSLPYTFEIASDESGVWFGRVRELPGCITEGDSREEAAAMLKDALAAWLEVAIRDGYPIPEPRTAGDAETDRREQVQDALRALGMEMAAKAEQMGLTEEELIAQLEEDRKAVYQSLYGKDEPQTE